MDEKLELDKLNLRRTGGLCFLKNRTIRVVYTAIVEDVCSQSWWYVLTLSARVKKTKNDPPVVRTASRCKTKRKRAALLRQSASLNIVVKQKRNGGIAVPEPLDIWRRFRCKKNCQRKQK